MNATPTQAQRDTIARLVREQEAKGVRVQDVSVDIEEEYDTHVFASLWAPSGSMLTEVSINADGSLGT